MKKIIIASLAMLLGSALVSVLQTNSAEAVNGENCVAPVADVGYRPSLYECNGNAAILLRGSLRTAYSVVLRRNGENNDRDPENPSCGLNRCSPFKAQYKLELPDYQVSCLGASGFDSSLQQANRISVKFNAKVTDSSDESQFQQYCLDDLKENLN